MGRLIVLKQPYISYFINQGTVSFYSDVKYNLGEHVCISGEKTSDPVYGGQVVEIHTRLMWQPVEWDGTKTRYHYFVKRLEEW